MTIQEINENRDVLTGKNMNVSGKITQIERYPGCARMKISDGDAEIIATAVLDSKYLKWSVEAVGMDFEDMRDIIGGIKVGDEVDVNIAILTNIRRTGTMVIAKQMEIAAEERENT